MINLKNIIFKHKYKFLLIISLIIIISLINTLLPYIIKQAIALTENSLKFSDIQSKIFLLVGSYLIITFICALLEFIKTTFLAKIIVSNSYQKVKE